MLSKIRIFLLLIIVFLIFYLIYYFLFSKKHSNQQLINTNIEIIKVFSNEIHDSINVIGETYANESVNLTVNVVEKISGINFLDGQDVRKGDVIIVLQQKEEQALLDGALASLNEAQREFTRIKKLIKSGAVSKNEYDVAESALKNARANLDEIKARIEDLTITAPFDGTLSIRNLSLGSLVQPGDIVASIEDLSSIKLDIAIPGIYFNDIKLGMKIKASSDFLPNQEFTAEIVAIDNKINQETRSILIRSKIENENQILKSGLVMKVEIIKNPRNAIIIPQEATIQKADKYFVWLVNEENQVNLQEIKVGLQQDGILEILSGLNIDENIVVRGVHKLRPNQKVLISKIWNKEDLLRRMSANF